VQPEWAKLSPSQLDLLRAHGIRPVKRRGQNFLLDANLARAIADDVFALGSAVLELGAGAGALTAPLLAAGASVTAVEVDRRLCALLRQELGAAPLFRLLEADLQRLDWPEALALAGSRPVVAGNLPYVLTSSVLFALVEWRERIAGALVMVQREVADRVAAAPGQRDYGLLAALLRPVFTVQTVRTVPPDVFWPRPEVASAVVRLVPRGEGAWTAGEYDGYRAVAKELFGQRRKKVGTLLRTRFGLSAAAVEEAAGAAGVSPHARPEEIAPEELRALARALAGRPPR
jgi:16S rRNA (adenine1518-N6/adenine1519-N6)-dimethyltransferase